MEIQPTYNVWIFSSFKQQVKMQYNSLHTEDLKAEIMGQNRIIRMDKIDFQNVQRIVEFCSLT